MNILILGPQGSGKSTQAQMLACKLNIPSLSIGRIYRREIKEKTAIGQKVGQDVAKGELASTKITEKLLTAELKKTKYRQGFVLDGFPRNLRQTFFLKKNFKVDYVVLIEIPQELAIKRLSARRICSKCGANYNIYLNKPLPNKKCSCGGTIIQRKDDYPRAIKARLLIYQKTIAVIIKNLSNKSQILRVSGDAAIATVFSRIKKGLKAKGVNI